MNERAAVERPGDEQRAASARIGAAGRLLREGKSDVPDGFAKLLFGHAAPEDVVGYEARELAALAPRGLDVPRQPQAGHLENPLRSARRRRPATGSRRSR